MLNIGSFPKVIGIGNALVDVIVLLENDDLLDKFGLNRGSMTLVDAELSSMISSETNHLKKEIVTGGSVANTIYSLACLGSKCGYIGKTGNDDLGRIFEKEFRSKEIFTCLIESQKETGRVMSLVSKDSERTMATYLGAASDLKVEEVKPAFFKGFTLLYMEGYLVNDNQFIEKVIDIAISEGLKIAIDLSSYNVVEANLEFLRRLIKEKVDIVFANEEEAKAFTGKEPMEALDEISTFCEIAIVKTGKNGSMIKSANQIYIIDSVSAKAIDTTGAGDNYAAGFFYGLSLNYNLSLCGKIASLISGKSVEVIGAKLPESEWPKLKNEIDLVVNQNKP